MLLSIEELKWVEYIGEKQRYRFVGKGKASKAEIIALQNRDKSFMFLYGRHFVENYEELYEEAENLYNEYIRRRKE